MRGIKTLPGGPCLTLSVKAGMGVCSYPVAVGDVGKWEGIFAFHFSMPGLFSICQAPGAGGL
jgi:hypothetical protein